MKKAISFFSAVTFLIGCFPLQAAAYAPYNDIKNLDLSENGCPWQFSVDGLDGCRFKERNWHRDNTFLAVTTSEGLPEDCADALYTHVMEWKDFVTYEANQSTPHVC